ncbi:AAA family ATPase [Alkalilimnicola ehrlichii]
MYHWLGSQEVDDLDQELRRLQETAEQVLDEFDRYDAIRQRARNALQDAEREQSTLLSSIGRAEWSEIQRYVDALQQLRRQRGRLITLRELRHMDGERLGELEQAVSEAFDHVSQRTVEFLLGERALAPYRETIGECDEALAEIQRGVDLEPVLDKLTTVADGLNLLSEVVNELEVDDPSARTDILEAVSAVFGDLNQVRARADQHRRTLGERESRAEFGAQFRLLSQSVVRALAAVDTPDRADQELSRLLLQLEELEGRFGEHDAFIGDLTEKREEIHEAFETRKQQLLEERQRRSRSLQQAAERILQGLVRRATAMDNVDDVNACFASDAMALRLRGLVKELRELGESVPADEIEGSLKTARDQAVRGLRDRQDIFEDDGNIIRLGRHRFTVNTQDLDLTLIPGDDALYLHLTGTDFHEPIHDADLEAVREYWDQRLISETDTVYRSEYLAATLLDAAETGADDGLSLDALRAATASDGELGRIVREAAASRYDEGYERGVHDHDAARILEKLVHLRDTAGLLRYSPSARAQALLWWGLVASEEQHRHWSAHCSAQGLLSAAFGAAGDTRQLHRELTQRLSEDLEQAGFGQLPGSRELAARYLMEELRDAQPHFLVSGTARGLVESLLLHLGGRQQRESLTEGLERLQHDPPGRYRMALAWLKGFVDQRDESRQALERPVLEEAAMYLLLQDSLDFTPSESVYRIDVTDLLGRHPRIKDRTLHLNLPEFMERLAYHREVRVPGFRQARQRRHQVLEQERRRLRVQQFQAGNMASFVRNQMVNEVYLPMLGDSLARQIGTAGDERRGDLSGMLLVISPPGYGKTMLMEYAANRLGLVFVKVNGPAIGHDVHSIDPAEAGNAAARQELEKINLALEMGNNVMLYLDDIQHCHSEFLQKFIPLCDGQRRIEGVWRGEPRTYNLRGKKFCVVMAGNPYTESGDAFSIPDMLANRADVYNLGDVIGGHYDAFKMSYIENSLTANSVLAPLASRGMDDFYRLVRIARGDADARNELEYDYNEAELNEIVAVLQRLFVVQDVVLRVNQEYIRSAGQEDAYRTEPPFRLQGSYRNMNRLAAKVLPVMNDKELEEMITDDYTAEAQTLTTGAEENLLKLAEMRGLLTAAQQERWEAIKRTFVQRRRGGGGDDPTSRIVGQLEYLGERMDVIGEALSQGSRDQQSAALEGLVEQMRAFTDALRTSESRVEVVNQPVPGLQHLLEGLTKTIEGSLVPVVRTMHHKLRLDHDIWDTLNETLEVLRQFDPEAFREVRLDKTIRRVYSPEEVEPLEDGGAPEK